MRINTLLVLCPVLLFHTIVVKAQINLKNTAWTVTQIASTNPNTPAQNVQAGEQILEFLNNQTYTVQNFLGIAAQQGQVITADKTLILGKDGGYFAVFNILKSTTDSLKIQYIPYESSANYLQVTLARYQTSNQVKPQIIATSNFAGEWVFAQGSLMLKLNIKQSGKTLAGVHYAGKNGEGRYTIQGNVNGNVATISLINEAGEVQGKAQAQSLGENISWGITSDVSKLNTVDSIVLRKEK